MMHILPNTNITAAADVMTMMSTIVVGETEPCALRHHKPDQVVVMMMLLLLEGHPSDDEGGHGGQDDHKTEEDDTSRGKCRV